MAYIPLPNVYPNMYVPYVGWYIRRPLIEADPVLLQIVEVIDYSLRYRNLHNWAPTWNLEFLRMSNPDVYFNEDFAETVINPNTEEQAIWLANSLGFNVRSWLDLIDQEESRRCMEYYLSAIFYYSNPFRFHMFSFACYASRMALQSNRNSLVNDVAWALLLTLRQITPIEEYYIQYYVINMYDNHHVNNQPLDVNAVQPFDVNAVQPFDVNAVQPFDVNAVQPLDVNAVQPLDVDAVQPLDVDEGIVDMADARRNDRSLSLMSTDLIILFVYEVIDYYLRYNNFNGLIPSESLPVLRSCRNEVRYFYEHLASTITHHCSEEDTLRVAYEWGFNEETWLQIDGHSEAMNFQFYFLEQVFYPDMFQMLTFACYTCKIARRRRRPILVSAVGWALVDFLYLRFPYQLYYRELEDHANRYNNDHHDLHSHSDDEGVDDVTNEVASSEDSNGQSDEEENEAR